jgi:hypothetical protein
LKWVLVDNEAHHDIWWLKEEAATTIADFICRSLQQDMICEALWVVLDATWDTVRNRQQILEHLKRIGKQYAIGPKRSMRSGRVQPVGERAQSSPEGRTAEILRLEFMTFSRFNHIIVTR